MRKNATTRLYASVLFVLAVLAGSAAPARAQFIRRSVDEPVVGEKYLIEGSIDLWYPNTQMAIASDFVALSHDVIDLKTDLGLTDQRFRELHVVFRPSRKHKLRYQYIPIKFDQSATLPRDVIFRGQRYTVGLPTNSGIDWRTHRFGYEYDFLSLDRGFGGFVLDVKQTNVRAFIESPVVRRESIDAKGPVPALGGIFRVYVVPNVSITGEITGMRLPEGAIKDTKAHYLDLDFYGTFNITKNVGAQVGFRRLDLGYTFEEDLGDFELKGIYFGIVARY